MSPTVWELVARKQVQTWSYCPGVLRSVKKGSQTLGKLKGGAVGIGSSTPLQILILPLSPQVTQLQQVHADWRQRLHRAVAPAVPVRRRGGSRAGEKEGAGASWAERERAVGRLGVGGREESWTP